MEIVTNLGKKREIYGYHNDYQNMDAFELLRLVRCVKFRC